MGIISCSLPYILSSQIAARPLLSDPALMIMFIDTAPEMVANGRTDDDRTTAIEGENCNNGKRVKENKNTSAVGSGINRFLFEAERRSDCSLFAREGGSKYVQYPSVKRYFRPTCRAMIERNEQREST